MSKQLLIMRHAKSDWSVNTSDFKRPLKLRGKSAAQHMGIWLLQNNLLPDYILSSPAERAKNTTQILVKAMGLTSKQIHYDAQLYTAELRDLRNTLATCPLNAQRVLLIGHNPELESLLECLVKNDLEIPSNGKRLPTATVAGLDMPQDWSNLTANCAKLLFIMRPKQLLAYQ
ncbi:MAG: phosphohistidine phosphatase [Methyloprofundus sp.]|nr:MAG: phosphohistidine phosphatase [Methyloprofundus sp.]